MAGIEGRIAGIERQLQMIPTTWQIVAMFTAFLFGIAAIIFATANFVAQ